MKNVNLLQSTTLLLTFIGFALGSALMAQPGGGGPTTPTPIGGIGILIAVGAALGYKKMKDLNQ